jgi:hypothetical protein
VNLPSGYHSYLDPEMLVLSREDGSTVALFSSRGFVAEAVEQAAWEDHSESEGSSRSCASSDRPPPRAGGLPRPPGGALP